MIRAMRWAVSFLTVIPLAPRGEPRPGELARAAAFFPLVGAGVGFAAWGIDLACSGRLPGLVRGLLVVASGAVLTRALHLDGLADTADGLGSFRDRAGKLEVMRDPHLGAFGAVTIVVVVLLQAACIAEIRAPARAHAIVAAAVSSRLSMTLAAWLFRYARESGKGSAIVGRVRTWAAVAACAFAALTVWAAAQFRDPGEALAALGVGTAAGLAGALYSRIRLGGVTGDVLGAAGETAQTAALVWAVAIT